MKNSRDPAVGAYTLICKQVNSAYSRQAQKYLSDGDFKGLASLDIKPSEYDDAEAFAKDYAVYAYLRKYRGFPVSEEDLKQKAKLDFKEIESRVSSFNRTLRYRGSPIRGVDRIISDARRKIRGILGPVRWSEILRHLEWGNGATATLNARNATIDQKILEPRLSVTRRCLAYARAYLTYDLHWLRARLGPQVEGPTTLLPCEFNIREDGRFDSVEKTIKTRRSIDIQPTLNLFFQKGVGKVIRRRLQRVGIDLDDQSRNQDLASVAQRDRLATIDLASASDTISRELVYQLLPSDWYELLDALRTHSIEIDGQSCPLAKFSAMGNGFTFELESLIFYALCDATRELLGSSSVVSVYGDDIIVSQDIASEVVETLEGCGFSVNTEKSYLEGRFYESCGKHFFDGVDVTPAFQKDQISDVGSAIRACNRIIKLSIRPEHGYLDTTYRAAWLYLRNICMKMHVSYWEAVSKSPHHLRRRKPVKVPPLPLGPWGLEGDGFVLDPWFQPDYDRNGIARIWEYQVVAKKRPADNQALLATSLRRDCVVETPFNGVVAVKGAVKLLFAQRRIYVCEVEALHWAELVTQ
jgi:hypothetical protein